MRNLFTLSLLLLICISAFSQKNKEVQLKWKISSNEKLTYQTIMNEIDTSNVMFNFDMLFKAFNDSTENETNKAKDFFKQLNKQFENIDMLSELTNNGNGTIEIVMKTKPKEEIKNNKSNSTDSDMAEILKKMQSMNQGVMPRGSVYETGAIHSFWIKSNQKNLIALLFELPNKPVKVGDSWKLDISLIANDQNFKCDSSNKVNKVTLIDLKTLNGEIIAVIKYEIEEFVEGKFTSSMFDSGSPTRSMMKFTHQAIAEFSISKGRWISYDGIMGMNSNGLMTANTKKKFSLIIEK